MLFDLLWEWKLVYLHMNGRLPIKHASLRTTWPKSRKTCTGDAWIASIQDATRQCVIYWANRGWTPFYWPACAKLREFTRGKAWLRLRWSSTNEPPKSVEILAVKSWNNIFSIHVFVIFITFLFIFLFADDLFVLL